MERGRFAHAMEECLVNGENKEEPEESFKGGEKIKIGRESSIRKNRQEEKRRRNTE